MIHLGPGVSPLRASSYRSAPMQRGSDAVTTRHISDRYAGLLEYLSPSQRAGMVARLATGFYEAWRPSIYELADLVAVQLGLLTWDQASERHRRRVSGQEPVSVIPQIHGTRRKGPHLGAVEAQHQWSGRPPAHNGSRQWAGGR